jgi:hypothetical protein
MVCSKVLIVFLDTTPNEAIETVKKLHGEKASDLLMHRVQWVKYATSLDLICDFTDLKVSGSR